MIQDKDKWNEYTISKDAMALVKGLQKQKEMLIAQLSVVNTQVENMVRMMAQSFVGDIPNGVDIKTDFENCKLMIEKFNMVPIRNPTGPTGDNLTVSKRPHIPSD